MVDIAELAVRIKADASQLSAEMKKVQAVVQQASGGMSLSLGGLKSQMLSLAPAISAIAFVNFAKGAIEAADRLNDLSQRTGIAASTLSALNIPLQQGGSSVDEFAGSINKMNNMIGEAAKGGSADLYKTFDKLGLSVAKLMQLSPEEQFYAIAKSLNEIKNQAEFTNTGVSIFGRSFATLAPLIRGANGDLDEFVKTAKKSGSALTEEQLATIDRFGDKWTEVMENLKLMILEFTPLLDRFIDAWNVLAAINPINVASKAGDALGSAIRDRNLPANASYVSGALSNKEAANSVQKSLIAKYDNGDRSKETLDALAIFKKEAAANNPAKGKNPNVEAMKAQAQAIKEAKKSLGEYNRELDIHSKLAGLTPKEQAGMEAYYKTLDLAQKAGIKNAEQLAEKNKSVAESTYAIKEAQDEARRSAEQMRGKLSDALTDAIMNFNSASDAAQNFAKAIAATIIQKKIADPLAMSLVGDGGKNKGIIGSVFGSLGLPSFDVGTERVPHDMVAKIHEDEMIIPAVQARAIRSGSAGGGGSIVVHQYFQVSNDVPALIEAHIRNAAPVIANATHDMVFASMQRGGPATRMAGLK